MVDFSKFKNRFEGNSIKFINEGGKIKYDDEINEIVRKCYISTYLGLEYAEQVFFYSGIYFRNINVLFIGINIHSEIYRDSINTSSKERSELLKNQLYLELEKYNCIDKIIFIPLDSKHPLPKDGVKKIYSDSDKIPKYLIEEMEDVICFNYFNNENYNGY